MVIVRTLDKVAYDKDFKTKTKGGLAPRPATVRGLEQKAGYFPGGQLSSLFTVVSLGSPRVLGAHMRHTCG